MRTLLKKLSLGLLVLSCLISMGAPLARAEDAGAPSSAQMEEKIAKWKKLKAENPEEFRRLIEERKQHLKEKLQELKEKDPQKFEEVKQRMFQQRAEHMRRLQKEDPQKYHEIVQQRWQKVEEFKTKNPERFKEFMDKHPRVAERWDKREQRHRNDRGPNFGKKRN